MAESLPVLPPEQKKPMATLVNAQTGDRKAVEVDSQQAQALFGQGYILETKTPTAPPAAPAAPAAPAQTEPAPASPRTGAGMATLVNNATGDRKAVAVGSQDAQALFGQGYILEKQAPTGTGQMATLVNQATGDRKAVAVGSPESKQLFSQGYVLELQVPGGSVAGPSGAGAAGSATPLTPEQQQSKYSDAMRGVIEQGANVGRDKMFSMDSNSFDNQLMTQRGLLVSALFGENLTPEDLRFLSPEQQEAIRSGKKEAIEAQVAGLGYVITNRREAMKAQEDARRQDERDALTRISTLGELGLFGSLSDDALAQLAQQTGLDPEALKGLHDHAAETGGVDWELDTDPDGNLVMYRFDPTSGTYESKIVQRKTVKATGGGGTKEADDTKRIRDFQSKAAEYIKAIDAPATESSVDWGAAWDSLRAEFPEASSETIDSVLGGRLNPDTGEYEGRATIK